MTLKLLLFQYRHEKFGRGRHFRMRFKGIHPQIKKLTRVIFLMSSIKKFLKVSEKVHVPVFYLRTNVSVPSFYKQTI